MALAWVSGTPNMSPSGAYVSPYPVQSPSMYQSAPAQAPVATPTFYPSSAPSSGPSSAPTFAPVSAPTFAPVSAPSSTVAKPPAPVFAKAQAPVNLEPEFDSNILGLSSMTFYVIVGVIVFIVLVAISISLSQETMPRNYYTSRYYYGGKLIKRLMKQAS